MIRIQDGLEHRNLRSEMLLQVHDELIFRCPTDEVEATKQLIEYEMTHYPEFPQFDVQVEAAVAVGDNWLEAH